MRLYLVRHAEAVVCDSGDIPDDYRVLSLNGREVLKKVGRWCVDQSIEIEQIISSPLLRAVQTAEILSAIINPSRGVDISLTLASGGAVGQILRFLPTQQYLNSLALVGHEPAIGMTASALLDIDKKVPFSPGSIFCCDFHGNDRTPMASFQWMLRPAYDSKMQTCSLKTISSADGL